MSEVVRTKSEKKVDRMYVKGGIFNTTRFGGSRRDVEAKKNGKEKGY